MYRSRKGCGSVVGAEPSGLGWRAGSGQPCSPPADRWMNVAPTSSPRFSRSTQPSTGLSIVVSASASAAAPNETTVSATGRWGSAETASCVTSMATTSAPPRPEAPQLTVGRGCGQRHIGRNPCSRPERHRPAAAATRRNPLLTRPFDGRGMLHDAATDLLAITSFPPGHWKKIWSTNPLERLDKEVNAAQTWPNHRPPLPGRSHHGPAHHPTTNRGGGYPGTDDGMI